MATPTSKNLILVPGLLCDALLWQPQIQGLAGEATCWVPDHTRHDSVAAIARAILDESPFETFALAGLSMGGYLSMEIVRQAPQRVERLALLDTTAAPDSEEAGDVRRGQMALWRESGVQPLVDAMMPRAVRAAAQGDASLRALIATMALNTGYAGFVRQQTAIMARIDSRPSLAAITCPTLVLCGREDVLTPPLAHSSMARAIAGARLVQVADAGHLSTLEQPVAVTAALRAWLHG
ncbi:MAG: putative non-heme bromoperoxidase BpoC [Paracidovorax wautersii]|uniref:Putative non-heme bromoperoxidase BpoC n=1 Tax=Paracidovorax wautersii TaxID=1177982 RepID=A0A7V8JNN0_9BURK|nr:MAG: putative non-heme bromoperoxidase BpoC [Paracidovorax wautersii]